MNEDEVMTNPTEPEVVRGGGVTRDCVVQHLLNLPNLPRCTRSMRRSRYSKPSVKERR